MKAVRYDRYGPPEVLRVCSVPTPEPGQGQVLVEVVATGVNLSDWECLVGAPAYARFGGLRRPARPVLGSDIAGRIVALGRGVSGFGVGDEVYGDNMSLKGGFAQYAVMPVAALAHKPAGLTFEHAAALPQPGPIARQGTAGLGPGARVLVNGGGGGSGLLALQLARRAGAHVTGVDTAAKLDLMREVGADAVVDYRAEDPFRAGAGYDLILDLVAHRSVFAYRRALARGGRYRAAGGTARTLLRLLSVGAVAGLATGRRLGVLAVRPGPEQFTPVADLCLAGDLAVHVDRVVDLDAVPDALARVGAGQSLGKIVVRPS